MTEEIWMDIIGFGGKYRISNTGRVISSDYYWGKSKLKGREFNVKNGRKRYANIALYLDDVRHDVHLHRMVALHFIPNPKNLPFVNHKDGNKLNNHVDNLEWCTPSQNSRHSRDVLKNKVGPEGRLVLNTQSGIYYDTITEAEEAHGIRHKRLTVCLRRIYKVNRYPDFILA